MAERKITHNKISLSEAIGFAWKHALKNFWVFFRVLLLVQIIGLTFSGVSDNFQTNKDISIQILGVLILLVSWVVSIEMEFAQLAIYLKFVDNKKAKVKDLFAYFNAPLLWRYFLVCLLLYIIIIAGFLLLIIPGIYFSLKYWFVPYIYVDKRTGVWESFKESAKLTKGIKWQLFRLSILQLLINIAGLLALVIGLFVTVPMNYLSDFYIYRKLSTKK